MSAKMSLPPSSEFLEKIASKDEQINKLKEQIQVKRLEKLALESATLGQPHCASRLSLVPESFQAGQGVAAALLSVENVTLAERCRDTSQMLHWLAEHVQCGFPTFVDIGGTDGTMMVDGRSVLLGRMATYPMPALGYRMSVPVDLCTEVLVVLDKMRHGGASAEQVVHRFALEWQFSVADVEVGSGEQKTERAIFLVNRNTSQGILIARWPFIAEPQTCFDVDQHFLAATSPQQELQAELAQDATAGVASLCQTYKICVRRSLAMGLGLVVLAQDNSSLLIRDVYVPSVIHEWNMANPHCMVLPGHRIVEVNGATGEGQVKVMHGKLIFDSVLTVTLLRHTQLQGSTLPPCVAPVAALAPAPNTLSEGQYFLTIQRPHAVGLDIGFRPYGTNDECLLISDVGGAGLIHQWNLGNPQFEVRAGHCIIEVNSISGPASAKEMQLELITNRLLTLIFASTPPPTSKVCTAEASLLSDSFSSAAGDVESIESPESHVQEPQDPRLLSSIATTAQDETTSVVN